MACEPVSIEICHLTSSSLPSTFLISHLRLEEMKTQEMPKMLNRGTEIVLMVRGNKMRMQNGTDQAGIIESLVLTRAVCENYLGDKPVSPAMKKAAWKGMQKLQRNSDK